MYSSTTRFRRDRMFLGRVLGFTTSAIYNTIFYYYACWTVVGIRFLGDNTENRCLYTVYIIQVTIATQTYTIIPGDYIKRIWTAIACSDGIRRF